MAVFDTPENERAPMTEKAIACMCDTALRLPMRHRMVVVDNGSTDIRAKQILRDYGKHFTLLQNTENRGTAKAINKGLQLRNHDEIACKVDDDIFIHQADWAEQIEEVMWRDITIGICALKRKDLAEYPDATQEFYRSTLHMLPHNPGQRWIVVENVRHTMGTCQAYSPGLLARVGFLWQPGVYGFDDSDISARAALVGLKRVFLPHIEIDHLDPGGNAYTDWKRVHAGEHIQTYQETVDAYKSKKMPLYRECIT